MNTFKAISLGELAARKALFFELIEKTDAAGLTDAKKSEKRSLQRTMVNYDRGDSKRREWTLFRPSNL